MSHIDNKVSYNVRDYRATVLNLVFWSVVGMINFTTMAILVWSGQATVFILLQLFAVVFMIFTVVAGVSRLQKMQPARSFTRYHFKSMKHFMDTRIQPMESVSVPFTIDVQGNKQKLHVDITPMDPMLVGWTYELTPSSVQAMSERTPAPIEVFPLLESLIEDAGDERAQRIASLAECFARYDVPAVSPIMRDAIALKGDD